MKADTDGHSRRRRSANVGGLSSVTGLGGRTRWHKYLRDIKAFAIPILLVILVESIIYPLLGSLSWRTNWHNILFTCVVIAGIPVAAAISLTAFRRHTTPITSALAVTAVFCSFAFSFLAQQRVPVSNTALAVCFLVAHVIMAYANLKFHRAIVDRIAIATFSRVQHVRKLLKQNIPLISDPGADISNVDIVLIDNFEHHREEWAPLLARCYMSGIEIMPWTKFMEIRLGRVDLSSFDISHIAYSPSQLLYARVKRFLDVAMVIVLLPVLVPLAGLVAAYIFLRDGGPVLFVQERRGYVGSVFRIYKFRTMYKGTGGGATQKNDRRLIPGCNFIRRARLDEIPQCFNILRGDMSWIGPRPVADYIACSSEEVEPKFAFRTLVLPGLTGWAQVTSGYAETTEQELEKLSYDLHYMKTLSFEMDMLIWCLTIKTVLFGSGAR